MLTRDQIELIREEFRHEPHEDNDMNALCDMALATLGRDEDGEKQRELLMDVATCGVSYRGTKYSEVQIDHDTWAKLQAFKDTARERKGEG